MKYPESMEDEDPALIKKYRAYLTRRSKWEAMALCADPEVGQVSVRHLRDVLTGAGELSSFLDEQWEKKVLGSDKFSEAGSGFYVLRDPEEEPSPTKPEWKGRRPGENPARDAYEAILSKGPRFSPETVVQGRQLLGSPWDELASVVVHNLQVMKNRWSESPLAELHEYAWSRMFRIGTVHEEPSEHAIILWLTVAMTDTDALKRLGQYIRTGENRPFDVLGPQDGQGSPIYVPHTTRYKKDEETGELQEVPRDPSPTGVAYMIRALLFRRGLVRRER